MLQYLFVFEWPLLFKSFCVCLVAKEVDDSGLGFSFIDDDPLDFLKR